MHLHSDAGAADLGDAEDVCVHCGVRDHAVDGDGALLPKPVAAILGLRRASATQDQSLHMRLAILERFSHAAVVSAPVCLFAD